MVYSLTHKTLSNKLDRSKNDLLDEGNCMTIPIEISSDRQYDGQILRQPCSHGLKKRVMDCLQSLQLFEKTGIPAIPYISAWRKDGTEIWYEYTSRRFLDLLGGNGADPAEVFRKSVVDRREYGTADAPFGMPGNVIGTQQLDAFRRKLREDGQASGLVEAVYKVSLKNGEVVWLKDRASVETFDADGICLSLGCLTVVSKEIEAEDEIKKHRDHLENLVRVRTAALTAINRQLKQEIKEREAAELKLQQSYQKLQTTMDGIIQAMSLTVEKRDPYTAGHQKRVAGLAVSIARDMGLDEYQIKGLEMAGLIHDMGKISVPAGILSKPGNLNAAEFELIRRHPQVAYEILNEIEFPWPVDKIVLQHHERFDGSGYPNGLIGVDTLLEARILSVADVVETISSHRPYRPGLGIDKALEEIDLYRELLYDPTVVDICLSLFRTDKFHFE